MKKNLLLFITTAGLLFTQHATIAQAVVLGEAADFVLFTTNGAVGATASTGGTPRPLITGNIGTNLGALTWYNNVNGVMHEPSTYTQEVSNDLTIAASLLTGMKATDTLLSLETTQTLDSGVYAVLSATSLNGTLTLDAQNNPNAKFIIKINGVFTADPFSKVVLINGAQACNVAWRVNQAVNLHGDTMKGTIVAGGVITITPGVYLEGRALTTTGAINVNQGTASLPLGCGTLPLNGPTGPDLRTTANFGLFARVGALKNTSGITRITGDVGSRPNAPTGFEEEYVSGKIYTDVSDPDLQGAANDLEAVYNYLLDLEPDIELTFPADFGHNLVLTPHTYHLGAATTLTDTLYLDGQGNPDAVFVIQINGAFNSIAGARVAMINGTQAKNVYWNIIGAVNLRTNTQFAGTLVVETGAIDLGADMVLAGRALAMTGAISTASASTIMNEDGTLLPVTWLSFSGKALGEKVLLEWTTANELNNGFFTIQKSSDGRQFKVLTTVNASAEIKNSIFHYNYTDPAPFASGFYKISQTDKDGQTSVYKTIQVKASINAGFKGLHYLRQNTIFVEASGAAPSVGTIKLFNLDGRLISSQQIMLTKETSTFKIDKPLSKGVYLIQIESRGENLYNKKLMVF